MNWHLPKGKCINMHTSKYALMLVAIDMHIHISTHLHVSLSVPEGEAGFLPLVIQSAGTAYVLPDMHGIICILLSIHL